MSFTERARRVRDGGLAHGQRVAALCSLKLWERESETPDPLVRHCVATGGRVTAEQLVAIVGWRDQVALLVASTAR